TNTTSSMPISDSTRRYEIVGNVADWTFVRIPVYAPRTANAKFANIRICAGTGTSDTLGIGGKFLFDELSFHEISVTDVKLTLPDDSGLISVGSSVAASTEIMMSNNDLLVPAAADAVTYTSSSPSAISVSDKGIVTAKKPGNAELKVSVNLNGKTFSVSKKMRALNDILNAAYAFGDVRGITVGQTKAIRPSGRMQSGKSAPLSNAKITYKSANPKVASVSAAGVVKALAKGSSDVSVSVTLDGVTRSTVVPVVVGDCKTESTIFTKSKVAAARKNVKQYDWAKAELKTATDFADKIADNPEFLWNAVPSQKLPRGITVGFIYDPAAWTCAYCGVDLRAKHGSYPYYMDPINKPWKIKCPDCNRWFPSNDFESYYKSGLNEQGEFVPALADKKFLVNELYPEKGTGWGVDDGYGYVTGKIQPNGVREVKTFIAYYIHWGLWQKTADKSENTALIGTGLNALKDAYLYTGDARYGRAGAILI
ncbi:MAG: Ig-like domain-containing protein, partial [Clostridia bacterium]